MLYSTNVYLTLNFESMHRELLEIPGNTDMPGQANPTFEHY